MSLKICKISKRFGQNEILRDFSYDFSEFGLYLIKGESGVGKTTLLRIIAGLDKDFDGEIIGGGPGNVSFAFQEHRLFPTLSAFDNVYKVAFQDENENNFKKTYDMLNDLRFSDGDMKKLPFQLSGGMKQRISLVRAFLSDKPILLLDEPTKELDRELIDKLSQMITETAKKKTVIMVTHADTEEHFLDAKTVILKKDF